MKPRIAVLGCGYWGRNLVRNFHELGVLGMVCDPVDAGRLEAKRIARETDAVQGVDQALGNADITAVAVATPAAMAVFPAL